MGERKKRAKPARTPSAYTRGDAEVNRLRSGIGVACDTCGAGPAARCGDVRGGVNPLLYSHKARREAGKRAADALVIARGRGAS
jgi:hypothetical protein